MAPSCSVLPVMPLPPNNAHFIQNWFLINENPQSLSPVLISIILHWEIIAGKFALLSQSCIYHIFWTKIETSLHERMDCVETGLLQRIRDEWSPCLPQRMPIKPVIAAVCCHDSQNLFLIRHKHLTVIYLDQKEKYIFLIACLCISSYSKNGKPSLIFYP